MYKQQCSCNQDHMHYNTIIITIISTCHSSRFDRSDMVYRKPPTSFNRSALIVPFQIGMVYDLPVRLSIMVMVSFFSVLPSFASPLYYMVTHTIVSAREERCKYHKFVNGNAERELTQLVLQLLDLLQPIHHHHHEL
jgi:hypothetical protein